MSRVRSAMSVRSNGTGASVRSIRSKGTAASSKTGGKGKVPTVFEFACTACAREKNNVEATNYCTDCAENLCASCVKQHLKFPAMKDHKVLGKEARRNPDDASPPRDSPLECPSHPGKSADMYCADHDEVRCGACIAVNHRTCINVMLVQQVARGVTKTEEFKTVKAEIQQAKKNLVSLKKRNERGLTGIEKQKVAIVNKIKATRTRLEQVLDSLEQNTLDELEKACARGSGQLKDDIKVYDDIMASIDAVTGLFSAAKSGSEGEIGVFVSMKRAKKKIEESARVFAFSKSGSAVDPIKFIPDSRISGWLKSLRMFGTFSFQKRVYVGELVGKYNVHTADDMRDCDIFGSEFMKNGTLLLCDWDNKCVKMLDSQLNVVEALNVDGSPSNICVINPTDAAVTLPMLKTVQLIQLQPKMALKHTIKTAESCRGIACHNAQLFVVCGGFKGEGEGKVIVYSISGDLIRTVERNNAGQRIFSCPIAIALSGDGKVIHVTDGHRGLITMTPENDVISVVADRDSYWPCGICMDKNDNALVCNGQSNTVIQVSGVRKIGTILSKKNGLKKPHDVSFDLASMRIVVTVSKSRFIYVYQLKTPAAKEVAEGTVTVNVAEDGQTKLPDINRERNKTTILPESIDLVRQKTAEDLKTSIRKNAILTNSVTSRKTIQQTTPSDVTASNFSQTDSEMTGLSSRVTAMSTDRRTGNLGNTRERSISRDRSESSLNRRNSVRESTIVGKKAGNSRQK